MASDHVGDRFLTTRWSVVRAAGGGDGPAAREAMAALCRSYWYPLYAFVRRKGVAAQDAEDVVQGFFQHVIAAGTFDRLTPEKGRFRSFLLACAQNHLANVRAAAKAHKRGGDATVLDVDFADAEAHYAARVSGDEPARAFDREWALTLLERALGGLREEYHASDRGALFDVLKGEITGDSERAYADHAAALGSTEGAIKVAVHRLRKRYRERLRAEIAQTVASEADVEAEIADLFAALGR